MDWVHVMDGGFHREVDISPFVSSGHSSSLCRAGRFFHVWRENIVVGSKLSAFFSSGSGEK